MKQKNAVLLAPETLVKGASGTALMDAARTLFAEEGVKGLSVRRVAESAGCTTMAVYSRFTGKSEILGALFDEGFEQLAQAQQAVAKNLKNEDRLVALCQAYRATAHAFPHHYALMLGAFSGELVPTQSSATKARATHDYLVDAVAATQSFKARSRAKCVELANVLFAFCHGWVSLEHTRFLPDDAQSSSVFASAVRALINAHSRR